MKKLNLYKSIQLIFMIIVTICCVFLLILDPDIYHSVATNTSLRTIVMLIWTILATSFLFLFLDFSYLSTYKHSFSELNTIAYSDSLSGIPNRQRVDKIVDKYVDKDIPDQLVCIMFVMSNLEDINNSYDHKVGDDTLKAFSGMLAIAGDDICFVARNGGNKFLALFEECTQEKLNSFLSRVDQKITAYNAASTTATIEYRYGIADQNKDKVNTVSQLIVLSDQRIFSEEKA